MEAVVSPEITAELTQILSNLVLGDNDIRQKYVFPSVFRILFTFATAPKTPSMTVSRTRQSFICSRSPSLR